MREIVEVGAPGHRAADRHASTRRRGPAILPALVAKVERAAKVLGWRAKRTDLARIVGDAWAWKQRAEQG